MKLVSIIIILLLLLPPASATVTREFSWNGNTYSQSFTIPADSTDRNVTIILTPTPFSDYDIPGYFVTESLPSGITFYGSNTEWSDLTDRTLNLLKFMPASDKTTITYTIRLDQEKKYDFFGTYKNENKFAGDIPTQTITVEGKPIINFSNIWKPNKKEELNVITMTDISSSELVSINASQIAQPDSISIPIIVILLITTVMLGYLVYKKHYSMPSPQKSKIDEITVISSMRESINKLKQQYQQKPQEVFEIIGDDDDEETTTQQEIELLKELKKSYLEDFNRAKDTSIKQQLMNEIFDLDKKIDVLKRKL